MSPVGRAGAAQTDPFLEVGAACPHEPHGSEPLPGTRCCARGLCSQRAPVCCARLLLPQITADLVANTAYTDAAVVQGEVHGPNRWAGVRSAVPDGDQCPFLSSLAGWSAPGLPAPPSEARPLSLLPCRTPQSTPCKDTAMALGEHGPSRAPSPARP